MCSECLCMIYKSEVYDVSIQPIRRHIMVPSKRKNTNLMSGKLMSQSNPLKITF